MAQNRVLKVPKWVISIKEDWEYYHNQIDAIRKEEKVMDEETKTNVTETVSYIMSGLDDETIEILVEDKIATGG